MAQDRAGAIAYRHILAADDLGRRTDGIERDGRKVPDGERQDAGLHLWEQRIIRQGFIRRKGAESRRRHLLTGHAIPDRDDMGDEGRDLLGMGQEQDTVQFQAFSQFGQQAAEHRPRFGIQAEEGVIQHQDPGQVEQGGGQLQLAGFSAGQGDDVFVRQAVPAETGRQAGQERFPLRAGRPDTLRGQPPAVPGPRGRDCTLQDLPDRGRIFFDFHGIPALLEIIGPLDVRITVPEAYHCRRERTGRKERLRETSLAGGVIPDEGELLSPLYDERRGQGFSGSKYNSPV